MVTKKAYLSCSNNNWKVINYDLNNLLCLLIYFILVLWILIEIIVFLIHILVF